MHKIMFVHEAVGAVSRTPLSNRNSIRCPNPRVRMYLLDKQAQKEFLMEVCFFFTFSATLIFHLKKYDSHTSGDDGEENRFDNIG